MTIIGTSQGLFSVYIRTSFFYVPVSDFNQYVFFIFFFFVVKTGKWKEVKIKIMSVELVSIYILWASFFIFL